MHATAAIHSIADRLTPDERLAAILFLIKDLGEARLLQVLSAIRHEVSAIELAREFSQPAAE